MPIYYYKVAAVPRLLPLFVGISLYTKLNVSKINVIWVPFYELDRSMDM